jgi:hypothetical protein
VKALDDVLDEIDAVAARILLYKIGKLARDARRDGSSRNRRSPSSGPCRCWTI